MLKKICFLFGVNMDDFAKEVITKMETYEKKEKRQFNKYDMAIGLFYGVGIFLGINRVLWRFIPKGQAIEELSDYQLVQINWYLNSRPLKCLNWHTPIEIFLLNLRH